MRSSDRLPRDNNLAVRNAWSRPERSTRLSRFNQNSFFSDAHVGFSGQSTSSYGVLQRLLDHAQAAATEALNLRAALLHDRSNLRHTEFIFDSGGFHVLSPDNVMDELQGGNQFREKLLSMAKTNRSVTNSIVIKCEHPLLLAVSLAVDEADSE